ncbi:hypothetical protein [Paenibacillus aceris]|uniref:Uncharacterized protein n=1 Tax=Paenibacillus aceris TaxID=869555 RepID=A0ABS4I7Y7_9BACL|nr:hypothetical protein [Paenibacillus aceris]MBP1966953.1 hypothetical protein [Paenibacillus aceris]NHW39317.1 hypothetical protein [Paenibacillus aceris]
MNELNKLREAGLIKKINQMKVVRIDPSEKMMVDNPTDLPLIAKEKKRAVFQIDRTSSLAIYTKPGKAEKEYSLLKLGAPHGITPDPYEYGPKYLVMPLMLAPKASVYLQRNDLTKEFAASLLQLHIVSGRIGFRGGHSPEDIYVMQDGTLKAVNIRDTGSLADHPAKYLLGGLGVRVKEFLTYMKELDPILYEQWTTHPKFMSHTKNLNR